MSFAKRFLKFKIYISASVIAFIFQQPSSLLKEH